VLKVAILSHSKAALAQLLISRFTKGSVQGSQLGCVLLNMTPVSYTPPKPFGAEQNKTN